MSIADKLRLIANNVQKVFDKGFSDGKQAEYDAFWDAEQEKGNRTTYSYGFYAWRAEAFNPKYPIIMSGNSSAGIAAFNGLRAKEIKVKVKVDCPSNNLFQSMLTETISELELTENATFTGWFNSSKYLANLNVTGVIANSGFNVSGCPLTHDSLMSIIEALKTYTDGSTHSITLGSTNLAKLTDAEKAIATEKGWSMS